MSSQVKLISLGLVLMILSMPVTGQQVTSASQTEKEDDRAIVATEFAKRRPGAARAGQKSPSTYRRASRAAKRAAQGPVQVGVTIWKLEPQTQAASMTSYGNRTEWTAKRVEADARFREGDMLRISIESPVDGFLYVVNRDLLSDGGYGETNLIFPLAGDDNRLEAGKLIDIPTLKDPPFKASPKASQSSECLTILVTSFPLQLSLGPRVLPISKRQLTEWEARWAGDVERLEMNGGAGMMRTREEQLAASGERSRQLTRADPMPQTIYSMVPRSSDGLLFNLILSYAKSAASGVNQNH